jgi:O-antigen ligase
MHVPARHIGPLEATPAGKRAKAKARAEPTRVEWAVAITAALVQQGAFLSIPLYWHVDSLLIRQDTNALNTLAVAVSFLSVAIASIWQRKKLAGLVLANPLALLFLALVLVSAAWSIHPDVTLRRGFGYVLTLLVAAYLTVRFEPLDRVKVLSYSFAISAVGSLLFVAAFPGDGIMKVAELAGNWRGVFPHKNVLGTTMAAGVFVQLLLLVSQKRNPRWSYGLLAVLISLVVLSHSATALVLCAFYFAGAGVYLLGRQSMSLGAIAAILFLSAVAIGIATLAFYPGVLFGIVGKDTTLTGRTSVWSFVISLIDQRPLLGMGYRAAWVLGDAATIQADEATGGWGVGNSHNAYLELALQLGIAGLVAMAAVIVSAFRRAIKCALTIPGPQGFFYLLFLAGTVFAGFVMETLGQNQVIEWVIFNVLLFGCGEALLKAGLRKPSMRGRSRSTAGRRSL